MDNTSRMQLLFLTMLLDLLSVPVRSKADGNTLVEPNDAAGRDEVPGSKANNTSET